MKKVLIVIPIYKPQPDEYETISFLRNIRILSSYTVSIVTYSGLDISYYTGLLDKYEITYRIDFFDRSYFDSLKSYNKLLLCRSFYEKYKEYDYILITQLDVYVFRDELKEWFTKEYDYIGAPWFKRFRSDHNQGKLSKVGNGGFSLRRVQTFLKVFDFVEQKNKNIPLFNFWNDYEFFACNKFSLKNVWERWRGINNNLRYYFNSDIQEDVVWSIIVPEAIKSFNVAPVSEAIKFSFESDPSYLYRINNNRLPFGCHAWHKNQYEEFWKEFIK